MAARGESLGSSSKFSLWFWASSYFGRSVLLSSAGNSGKGNPAILATLSLSGGKNGARTGAPAVGVLRRILGQATALAPARQGIALLTSGATGKDARRAPTKLIGLFGFDMRQPSDFERVLVD